MSLEEIGNLLRQEREKKGYSIEAVAARLKISARVIRALEEADLNALPHAAYVRGFVRSYGSFLGFAPDDVEEFAKAVPMDAAAAAPTVTPVEEPAVPEGRGSLWGVAILALLIAGALALWFNRDAALFSSATLERLTTAIPLPARNKDKPTPAKPAPDKPAPDKPAPDKPGADKPAPDKPGADKPAPEKPAGPAEKDKSRAASREQGAGTPPGTAPAASAGSPQTGAPQTGAATVARPPQGQPPRSGGGASLDEAARQAAAVVNNGQHKIIITAFTECWIHSSADGTDTRQFSLHKGDTFALTFAQRLELKLGNAGGVRLRYNGQDMPEAGKDGQVKTLVFPPAAQ